MAESRPAFRLDSVGEQKMETNAGKQKDSLLQLCIAQGYVPKDCYLPGVIAFVLVNKGEDPCRGCNLERKVCGGRPKG